MHKNCSTQLEAADENTFSLIGFTILGLLGHNLTKSLALNNTNIKINCPISRRFTSETVYSGVEVGANKWEEVVGCLYLFER